MHIYCPKCNVGYEIDEQLIKNRSRKLKCSNCGDIFVADELSFEFENSENNVISEEDALNMLHIAMTDSNENQDFSEKITELTYEQKNSDAENENNEAQKIEIDETEENTRQQNEKTTENEDEDSIDLESIFERLSEHTEHLMAQEKKLPFYEKLWLQMKNILGFHFKIRWRYVVAFIMVFVVLSLFNNRYQIVREVPFMNSLYKAFGINAKIPGEGLEFQNISWEFFDDESVRLEIKGFIFNKTEKNVELPVVHIEILDKDTALLQSLNREVDENEVEARAKMPLDLVIDNPAPTAKYVYLTFIEKD